MCSVWFDLSVLVQIIKGVSKRFVDGEVNFSVDLFDHMREVVTSNASDRQQYLIQTAINMASIPTSESSRSMSGSKSSLDTLDSGPESTISQKTLEAIRIAKREISRSKINGHSAKVAIDNSKSLTDQSLCPVRSALCKVPPKDWPVVHWKKLSSSGYSLVQEAILSNNVELLEDILKLCSVNLNLLKCSQEEHVMYPLHFACRLGYADVISLLLDHGANLTKASKVIPPPHMVDCEVFQLSDQRLVPLWHALLADQVTSLQVLLTHRRSSYDLRPVDALKAACSAGAVKCVQWLLLRAETDSDFATVLFYKKNMIDIMTTLVALSVKIEIIHTLKHCPPLLASLPSSVGSEELASDQLHRIFSQPQCINLHAATDFLVAFIKARATPAHMERLIQHKDSKGNTSLHILCQRHNNIGDSLLYYSSSFKGGLGSEQGKAHFLKDHVTCLTLLLNLGANSQESNQQCIIPPELLFPTVGKKQKMEFLQISNEELDVVSFELLAAMLQKLVIQVDSSGKKTKSQLLALACQMASCTFTYNASHCEKTLKIVSRVIELLLKHGCDPNCRDRNGKTGIYNLMYSVWYCGVQTEFKPYFLRQFNCMLLSFVEHGLNVRDVLPQVNRYYLGDERMNGQEKISCSTYLCEMVGMLRDTFPPNYSDLGHSLRQQLHQQLSLIVLTLLRHGDPDMFSLLVEERFLPGANVEYASSSLLEELVYLYLGGYSNGVPKFNEQYLNTILFLIHNFIPVQQWPHIHYILQEKLETFDTTIWNGLTFWQERVGVVLQSALSSPAPLQQQSRLLILDTIGWQQAKVNALPVSAELHSYLRFNDTWQEIAQLMCQSRESDF